MEKHTTRQDKQALPCFQHAVFWRKVETHCGIYGEKKNIHMCCWVDVKLKNLDSNAVERSLLLRSPMGQKNLAILTGDRINEGFFYKKMYGCFVHADHS